ncbi:monoacylglycerol lipase ABHD6-like [Littorina saxatilis]
MWSLVPYIAGTLAFVAAIFLLIFFLRPGWLVQILLRVWRRRSGMQVKFIGDGEYVFCYGERGQKSKDRSSILCIHGFSSSKDQWNTAFKNLPKEYHIVAMDMPGHGATSTPPESQDLSLDFAMETIKRFADLVGLTDKPFHVVGASLGGCMAGLFAATYPEIVERVTMICPAMRCPEDSDFSLQVEKAIEIGADNIEIEHCSLLPQSPHEMQLMLDSCLYAKSNVNKQILQGFMDLRCPKNPYFLRVFKALATEDNVRLLENNCHRISVPSQIIWGDHDRIIHPSGAKLLKSKLPDCRDVTILENCGHSVDLDRPLASCKAIARFRGDDMPSKKAQ